MAVDVPLSAKHFRYFAGCILADEGQATVLEEKFLSIVLREPIGVVGQIIPWNFPIFNGSLETCTSFSSRKYYCY